MPDSVKQIAWLRPGPNEPAQPVFRHDPSKPWAHTSTHKIKPVPGMERTPGFMKWCALLDAGYENVGAVGYKPVD